MKNVIHVYFIKEVHQYVSLFSFDCHFYDYSNVAFHKIESLGASKEKLNLLFLYKQPVYKQLALRWKIGKKLPELNPLALSNNKNCGVKKSGVFLL